ncbi:hypothetical protein [Burkholderia sp. Bp9031]|uniref:hypothetical protein n=1 Tax=Burkholderia sp. Bp9031 TaxID=2184566 RepID=UPI000F5E5555|nr:hypothetical protein [Burkholderia sp. Bp9031]
MFVTIRAPYGATTTNIRIIATVPMMIDTIPTKGTNIVFLLSPCESNITKLYNDGYDFNLKGMTNIATSVKTKHTSRQWAIWFDIAARP